MPDIEQKIKLLQLVKINNINLEVDDTIKKTVKPVIGISDLKNKSDKQILNMLDNKLEKSIDALSRRKYKVIKSNVKIKPKLRERVKKILNVGKNKNILKRMFKEFIVTEELGKQNEQLIKRIQTSRNILSTKKIDKDDISTKIDKAKEINIASKKYVKDATEGNNIETGIVKRRKKLIEGQLNKVLSQNVKRNEGKEFFKD